MAKVDKVDPKAFMTMKVEGEEHKLEPNTAILYALGIGFSRDHLKAADWKYTYEYNEDFSVFPTFGVVAHKIPLFEALLKTPGMPTFNPMMLLHGEQKSTFIKPLKAGSSIVSEAVANDIADKGKAAAVSIDIKTYEINPETKKKELCTINTYTLFIRGIGGFGYKGTNKETIPNEPSRPADKTHKESTFKSQALLYRLSGDYNPLHVDPNMAALGGFKEPILHGLCTYGLTAKAINEIFCGGDHTQFKSIYARFTSHVFPGETLIWNFWQEVPTKIIFNAKTEERGLVVIKGVAEIAPKPKL